MSNAIIIAALTERVQMCVAAGLCVCTVETVDPNCPCHNIDGIALNGAERIAAIEVLADEKSEEQELANPT